MRRLQSYERVNMILDPADAECDAPEPANTPAEVRMHLQRIVAEKRLTILCGEDDVVLETGECVWHEGDHPSGEFLVIGFSTGCGGDSFPRGS
jgi:hypothetical protein